MEMEGWLIYNYHDIMKKLKRCHGDEILDLYSWQALKKYI